MQQEKEGRGGVEREGGKRGNEVEGGEGEGDGEEEDEEEDDEERQSPKTEKASSDWGRTPQRYNTGAMQH